MASVQESTSEVSPKSYESPPQPSSSEESEQKTNKAALPIICNFCNTVNAQAKLCSRCRLVYYCDRDCQSQDWQSHKKVCKAPQKRTVVRETVGEDGLVASKTKTVKAWTTSQIAAGKSQRSVAQSQGRLDSLTRGLPPGSVSFIRSEDEVIAVLLSFTLNPRAVDKLRESGYSGLNSTVDGNIDELVANQNYTKLLKYIRTEEDLDALVAWLTPYAEEGHTVLMLELSRALSLLIKKTNNPSKNNIKEVLRWFELGLHCARLDAACINNEEIKKAVTSLEKCYKANVTSLYKMKKIKNSSQWRTKNGATKLAICTTWDPTISNLSPQWIGNHGIKAAYLGELPDMKDESDWLQARRDEHEAILRELSQSES